MARAQEQIEDSANALEEEFQKRVETATSRLVLMDNAINDLKISLGEAFLPMVKSVADAVAGSTSSIIKEALLLNYDIILTRNLGMLIRCLNNRYHVIQRRICSIKNYDKCSFNAQLCLVHQ